ncbi:ABC transporter permease [Corynebacterium sp. A21]|uniref:ABC transporter permease n=1 Tax=Corynebacterium sp. A21 TaxID=3457318 RepID=UPI003FD662FE
MNLKLTAATAARVLAQLRADPRSIALILVAPMLLMVLFYYLYRGDPGRELLFTMIATVMIAIFPLTLMFLVTSVTMQRERSLGTLERLWTTRMHRADLILGYAIAFGIMAILQSFLLVMVMRYGLGIETAAPWWITVCISAATGLTSVALGLFSSAFASSEFQAVQALPVLIIPQILLCGLLVPRAEMPTVLERISDFLPLSYAVDAALAASTDGVTAEVVSKTFICLAFAVGFLCIAAATMPRRLK